MSKPKSANLTCALDSAGIKIYSFLHPLRLHSPYRLFVRWCRWWRLRGRSYVRDVKI